VKDARREGSPYPKADLTLRALARLADLALAFAFANAVPQFGPPIAALYLLVADGLTQGQSIGKKIFGVRTVVLPPEGSRSTRGAPAGYRESILRNAAFGFVALFFGIGFVGWLVVVLVGVPVIAFEAWMVWSDRLGIRIGDIFADTQVVDGKVVTKAVVPAADLRTPAPQGPATGAVSGARRAA
jgi:uncharacterized RDD family membrane protein YckC